MKRKLFAMSLLMAVVAMPTFAQIGDFDGNMDIGEVALPGDASFADGVYSLSASGADIWGTADQGHFVYKEMTGNYEIEGDIFITALGEPTWTKVGMMARQDLEADSPFGWVMIRSDGDVQTAGRPDRAVDCIEIPLVDWDAGEYDSTFKMVKIGSTITGFYKNFDDEWVEQGSVDIAFSDPSNTYLCLALTAHDNALVAEAEFSNLVITELPWGVSRVLASEQWTLGASISGNQVIPEIREGVTTNLTITENVPVEATLSNVSANVGDVSVSGNTITWTLTGATAADAPVLTYDIQAPMVKETAFLNFSGEATDGTVTYSVGGSAGIEAITYNISETFSYPLNEDANDNAGVAVTDVVLEVADEATGALKNYALGWLTDKWVASGPNSPSSLNPEPLQAGAVEGQPLEFNFGNFSLEVTGEAGDGVGRQFPTLDVGEVWISFTYKETGDPAEHWSGLTMYNADGGEELFIGKPYNAETLGLANLVTGDSLSSVDYKEANHLLVRVALKGAQTGCYLWINPDEDDRLDTYDAGGDANNDISNLNEIRLRRGGKPGSAFYDNIWISTDPALPPAGAGRVDLTLNSPDRDEALPAWDVVSVDQFDDAINDGTWGYGHDNGDNHYLIVTGNIYYSDVANLTGQIVGYGLPPDRMSGLNGHFLGPYNNAYEELGLKNAMKFENNDEQRGPFTFDVVPAGNYASMRACMTVGNGDGRLLATLNYADGTSEDQEIHGDDWYHDPPNDSWNFVDTLVLINGMNRLDGGNAFDGRFDPGFMEDSIPVDETKVLESVTLQYHPEMTASVAYNLFDILAIPPVEVVPVSEWALY